MNVWICLWTELDWRWGCQYYVVWTELDRWSWLAAVLTMWHGFAVTWSKQPSGWIIPTRPQLYWEFVYCNLDIYMVYWSLVFALLSNVKSNNNLYNAYLFPTRYLNTKFEATATNTYWDVAHIIFCEVKVTVPRSKVRSTNILHNSNLPLIENIYMKFGAAAISTCRDDFLSNQDIWGQGHCDKVKGQIHYWHRYCTPSPHKEPVYQIWTSYA